MTEEIKEKVPKKETFLQGVITLIFSQVLIKLLGLIYTLYLTNRSGFGDRGNGIVAAGYQIYAMLLTISSIGVPNAKSCFAGIIKVHIEYLKLLLLPSV